MSDFDPLIVIKAFKKSGYKHTYCLLSTALVQSYCLTQWFMAAKEEPGHTQFCLFC